MTTMMSPMFAFHLMCLLLGDMAQVTPQFSSSHPQQGSFVTATLGGNLVLPCFYNSESTRIYWYKQSLGQKPRLISAVYVFNKNYTFHPDFDNNPRITLDADNNKNHLTITNLSISDSASYYCAKKLPSAIEFAAGIFVSVKGSELNVPALVHQSASESAQPGGSVTLNCTVQTGTCDGEHNVYWFRNSGESHPGLIYTNRGRNDQCERNTDTQTHTCVYNLPMKSLNVSHAGSYDCAVASCGHILFGNGTKLDSEHEADFLVLVYFLNAALTFTTVLVVLMAFWLYKMFKRSRYSESQKRCSAPTANTAGHRDADDLHYSPLSLNLPNRSTKERSNIMNKCVYSTVKL